MTTLCPTAGKPTFTKGLARVTLRYLQRRRLDGPGRMSTYPCPDCHRVHLGHPDPLRKKGKR